MLRFYLSRNIFSKRLIADGFRELAYESFDPLVGNLPGNFMVWPDFQFTCKSGWTHVYGNLMQADYDEWEALTEAGELWLMANMPPTAALTIDQL